MSLLLCFLMGRPDVLQGSAAGRTGPKFVMALISASRSVSSFLLLLVFRRKSLDCCCCWAWRALCRVGARFHAGSPFSSPSFRSAGKGPVDRPGPSGTEPFCPATRMESLRPGEKLYVRSPLASLLLEALCFSRRCFFGVAAALVVAKAASHSPVLKPDN